MYHSGCIIEWFRRDNKSCPQCRSETYLSRLQPKSEDDRIRRLMRESRRPDAPMRLQLLVQRYRSRIAKRRMARRELLEFRRGHRLQLKVDKRLARRMRAACDQEEALRVELSAFVDPCVPVPLFSVCSDSELDSDE